MMNDVGQMTIATARMPAADMPRRWAFDVPTPLGANHLSYELAVDGLHFTSDDPFHPSQILPWSTIKAGATAAVTGMGGKGAPTMPDWVPSQMEWLLLSRADGGARPFMGVLPQGDERDAFVAAIQVRLGSAWIGTRLPLNEAQQRLGIADATWSTLKVAGLVIAVLAMLPVLLMMLVLLLNPFVLVPAGVAVGVWMCRKGLVGLRDGLAVANTPTARAGSAPLGLVELAGRVVADAPSAAAVTGRPAAWWDVSVRTWYEDSDGDGEWRQVAARHGGRNDLVEVEDDSGKLPVWLPGATLLLKSHQWESGKDALPARGIALLDEIGYPWTGGGRLLVTEACVEIGQPLYVIGTLDLRRNLRDPAEAGLLERGAQLMLSGQWRRAIVDAAPTPLRPVLAVLIAFLGIVGGVGHGGERAARDVVGTPPPMPPEALVVWQGRNARPFVVSDHHEQAALQVLRKRSLVTFGLGVAVLCYTLYQLIDLFSGN